MSFIGAGQTIHAQVSTWEYVEFHPHRFGGVEYRIGRREIGHVHGDHLVDIPFPKKVRDEIVTAGKAMPHHVLPQSGWVSFYIHTDGDVGKAIDLMRHSYEIALKQRSLRAVSK